MADTDDEYFKFPMSSDVGGKPKGIFDVCEQLDSEIRFANGLVAAIYGALGHNTGKDEQFGAAALAETHVRRLQSIRDGLAALEGKAAKKAKKAKRKG